VRTRNVLLIISTGAASGVLWYFGTGLHPIWWLLWLAPVPVLAIAPEVGWRTSFLLAIGAWFVGALNQWDYFKHEVELPQWVIAGALLMPGYILRARRFVHA